MEIRPPAIPFLPAKSTLDERSQGIIFGAPFDKTATFRKGQRAAPEKIREVSESLESYSLMLRRDLSDVNIIDWGDINFADSTPRDAVKKIQKVAAQAREESFFIMLGGEHTVTIGAVRAMVESYPDLVVICLDAHFDLRSKYQNDEYSHATVSKRIIENLKLPQNLIQLGIRSGAREEAEFAAKTRHYYYPEIAIPTDVRSWIAKKPVYISIDIDVLDPSSAPGTGNPEPGGCTYDEVFSLLYSLKNNTVVGLDVVEVLPEADAGDCTSVLAAKLVREALLIWAK